MISMTTFLFRGVGLVFKAEVRETKILEEILMYRLAYLSGNWIAVKVYGVTEDLANAATFLSEGTPVMYVETLEDIPSDIEYEVA